MSVAVFTLLPGVFLIGIGVYCVVASVRTRTAWFAVVAVFVGLMAVHQAFELAAWLETGVFPNPIKGEIPETTVNLLGAAIALHLVRSRMALQRQLREREQAETIFQTVQDAIFVLRAAGDGLVVERTNPAFRAAFLRGDDPGTGVPLAQMVAAGVAAAIEPVVGEVHADAAAERVVQLDVPEAGSYWHVRIVPVPGRRGPTRFVGVARDVSRQMWEQHRREAHLEDERVRAERANAAKTSFLARMSHELRTPLNAILGMAEVIRDRVMGDDLDRYSTYAADIHTSSEHLLALINDLLDMSRLDSDRYELDPRRVDTAEVLRHAGSMVQAQADRAGVHLDVAAEAPPLLADERALRQMVANLLTNAVKFTEAGGRVRVRAATDAAGWLAITVADDGVGIPPEDQARILEPFEQGRERVSADRAGGTGLGLAICHKLMRLHDGELHLDSTPGAGTTVTLRFPPGRVMAPSAAEREVTA
ncbi:Signal transduction histidine kinase [Limimonas halophila]|uniref:histidine kinase n=1 Tax=Limimonas halophila TaxID=1082479 RepID=A0A1G7M7R1_9PROT|nr:PAS domain-containing sensor histidine kinase [Limimonas halophila]SDF57674.1 Signal transduction histidine kinase [Limimonas halophila]